MTTLVVLLILGIVVYGATRRRRSRAPLGATPLVDRVAFLERRVVELQDAVDKLRRQERAAPQPAPAPEPEAEPAPASPAASEPEPTMPPPLEWRPSRRPAPSFDWRGTASAADLFSSRARSP